MPHPHPRPSMPVNHVGLSVTDIERSIAWYEDLFGFRTLRGPLVVRASDDDSEAARGIFGPQWGGFKIAHLASGNGVGLELFEFLEPRATRRVDNFDYHLTGFFHVAITCSDIRATAAALEAAGGRVRSEIYEIFPDIHCCYAEDIDGNVLELIDASYEVQQANR